MIFSYTAKNKIGEIVKDSLESQDRLSLSKELRARGLVPLTIRSKGFSIFELNNLFAEFFSKIKLNELVIFTNNLSGMLKAGLSLSRALSVLEKQNSKPIMRTILSSLIAEINSGGNLSSGLAKFPKVFSKLFVSMVKAGEESGNLSGALSDVGLNLEKANNLTKKIHGALIYPGVILSAMVLVGVLMFAFVVPTLASTFEELGVTLPTSTRAIIWLGQFFSENLILTFVLIILSVFGLMLFFRAKFIEKYVDFILIKLPIVGEMTKELNTARTTRTISSLLSSGVSIIRSLEIAGDVVQNIYFKKILKEAEVGVAKGVPLSKILGEHNNLYPVMMSEMVQVGEETGKLSDMLLQIAIFFESKLEDKTKNLSTIIEPVLMVLIGAGVGFFAISMISPLYSILNNIK